MFKGDGSESRTRAYPQALEAPLNQRPKTLTGRLVVVLLNKQYGNFLLQFSPSAFLYSEIRAKICSGLGRSENIWRTQVVRPALPREDGGSLCPSSLLSPLSFGLFTPFYKLSFPGRELSAHVGRDLLPSSRPSRSRLSRGLLMCAKERDEGHRAGVS